MTVVGQDVETLIKQAGARCQCEGACGENHAWVPEAKPVRCRAPQGCNIVRKKDHSSFWMLAAVQGMDDDGEPVRTADLAYPEFFRPKHVTVQLEAVRIGEDAFAFCQRCALLLRRKRGEG